MYYIWLFYLLIILIYCECEGIIIKWPVKYPINTKNVYYNICKMLDQRRTNGIQMFCVCWVKLKTYTMRIYYFIALILRKKLFTKYVLKNAKNHTQI